MTLDSLQSLYIHELQDLYSAETQLGRALPKLAKAASSPELKSAFTSHLAQTKAHAQRLEQLLHGLGEAPGRQKCKGMAALIKEGQELIKAGKNGADPAVLDSGLITAAQKAEHYEIAGYGAARSYAQRLRDDDAVNVLQQTLHEESQADATLTEVAQTRLKAALEARPGGDSRLQPEANAGAVDNEDRNGPMQPDTAGDEDTYKGATEELDNDAPRNWPDESSGLGARSEPGRAQEKLPTTGD